MGSLSHSRAICIVILLALMATAFASSSHAAEPLPDIVIVVFDELPTVSLQGRDGGIDAALYPHFAELAATSTWARGHSTVATRLLESVPALLTGRMPGESRQLSTRAEYPQNLFSWLEPDYDLEIEEQQSILGPTRLDADAQAKWLIDVRRDSYKHPSQVEFFERFVTAGASRTPTTEGRPALRFIHLMLPYGPWRHAADGSRYAPIRVEGNVGEMWTGDPALAEDAWRRHLNEARLADALLGQLIAALEAADGYDSTLLVVTSSYGTGFWPGESRRTPSRTTHPEDVLLVPLFVKAPGQVKAAIVDDPVRSIDVLPTIADVLGRALPWPADGCSLFDEACERSGPQTVMRLDGSPQSRAIDTIPVDLHKRTTTLERKWALYPDAAHLDRSWPAGRYDEWMGRRVDAAGVAKDAAPAGTFELNRRARGWASQSGGSARIVAHVNPDRAPSEGAEPLEVAIVVNDRIEAIVPVVPDFRGRLSVRGLFPMNRPERGGSVLELYVIESSGDTLMLAPLERTERKRRAKRNDTAGPPDATDRDGP